MRKFLPVLLVLVLLPGKIFAGAKDDFNKGVAHFKQKDYPHAVKAFKRAAEQGLKTPALWHNLGVSYFKMADYVQAKKYFESLRAYPRFAILAEYNLGLVAKKQNQPAIAKAHFTKVRQQADDSGLVKLAQFQLGEITVLEPKKSGFIYTEIGYGHDDNITAVPENSAIATQQADNFTNLYIAASYQILGDHRSGLSLNGFYSRFDYANFDQYDDFRLAAGVEASLQTGNWHNALRVSTQDITFGHNDYQTINRFQARTGTAITSDYSLRLRYRYDDIRSRNPSYDYLAGTRQRFRTELRNHHRRHYTRFYHELETNDRADTTTESFSPTRHTLRVYYEYALTQAFNIGGDIKYRISRYPAGSNGGTPERTDRRQRLGIKIGYRINRTWRLRARYEQTDNSSDNPDYAYQREETSLSVIASF